MDRLQIDPDGLETGGTQIQAAANQFTDALSRFVDRIEGFGDACGGDEIGGLIGAAHQEVFAMAKECFEIAAEEIAEAGGDLCEFGSIHRVLDEEIAQVFQQLDNELGGS